MNYKILQNGELYNRIVAEPDFVESYCLENGFTYELEPELEPGTGEIEYTETELLQQEITDLQLSDIEQGQAITDLELIILEGRTVNV